MDPSLEQRISALTGASALGASQVLQRLWSGYGEILRVELEGAPFSSVIVKHVQPEQGRHPRGWNTDRSHQRKLRSYQVETAWYRNFAARCNEPSRVPACLAVETQGDELLLILEDLDAAGFPGRRNQVNASEFRACIEWLAAFHACFLGVQPDGLWETGTYWHLETRPDELEALDDRSLQQAAPEIDRRLKNARHQTLVHGDAKLANFCFSEDGSRVAVVDFQYVGAGCGMKDLAYLVGSCLDDRECEAQEAAVLDQYFAALHRQGIQAVGLEEEWRALYPVAWTDFHRFLKGWSPGHWKLNDYSERVARAVVDGAARR